LIYAVQNDMPVAQVKNAAGKYITPSTDSVTAALASAQIPDDFRFSMTDVPGPEAYPISGVTWLLVYKKQEDPAKGAKMVQFLKWALTKGEEMAPSLDYAPLPDQLRDRVLKRVSEIQVGG
jgi:phosphate transport system substrate-binding protein